MPDAANDWAERMRRVFNLMAFSAVRDAGAGPDIELEKDLAEERAAIIEYDAGLPRADAEAIAFGAAAKLPVAST